MKKLFLLFFLFIGFAFRTSDIKLVTSIDSAASYITTDNLGNLYLIVNNELRKYDSDGNILKTFSDKSHGALAFVDVSNPLQILLFYRDFRQIVFLDNMLSIKGDAIMLDNIGLQQPLLACSSYENGFWIYDEQDFQLIRFDKNLQKTNQSGNLSQLTGIEIKPNFLNEAGDKIYLNDPENGILVFDKYGTYAKMLPFKKLNSFQIKENNIVYSTDSSMVRFDFKTFEEQSIKLQDKKTISARIEKDKIFIQDAKTVKIFLIK